jgi:hypothetical protein
MEPPALSLDTVGRGVGLLVIIVKALAFGGEALLRFLPWRRTTQLQAARAAAQALQAQHLSQAAADPVIAVE